MTGNGGVIYESGEDERNIFKPAYLVCLGEELVNAWSHFPPIQQSMKRTHTSGALILKPLDVTVSARWTDIRRFRPTVLGSVGVGANSGPIEYRGVASSRLLLTVRGVGRWRLRHAAKKVFHMGR